MRSDLHRVDDILSAVAKIEKYAARGSGAFFSDELIQVWVLHHLQVIGEALRSMTEEFQTRFKDSLEWSGWIGLRTIVAHHYFHIDPVLIWQTVERDIPALKTNMLAIREALPNP
jgi:uncharacterized protein with HEPN domain